MNLVFNPEFGAHSYTFENATADHLLATFKVINGKTVPLVIDLDSIRLDPESTLHALALVKLNNGSTVYLMAQTSNYVLVYWPSNTATPYAVGHWPVFDSNGLLSWGSGSYFCESKDALKAFKGWAL